MVAFARIVMHIRLETAAGHVAGKQAEYGVEYSVEPGTCSCTRKQFVVLYVL
jgi:hypothetical protein